MTDAFSWRRPPVPRPIIAVREGVPPIRRLETLDIRSCEGHFSVSWTTSTFVNRPVAQMYSY
ncbi:hypothetical protein C7T36_03935 [Rhodococcus sp. AD45-ID]|nr:hypothetical protein C7T36_03935 [Rhodococcus sp. AD45-ID]